MSKTIKVFDPYRNRQTTITQFAQDEGVKRYTAAHYYWYHNGSLEGFRNRPKKGYNGIACHTYTHKGKFIDVKKLGDLVLGGYPTLIRWHKQGYTDIEEINRLEAKRRDKALDAKRHLLDDGRRMTISQVAKEAGVTNNTVSLYLRNHHGSLKGFFTRGYSRVNPKKYPDNTTGICKTVKEWAQHYNVSLSYIKGYVTHHRGTMDGFANRPLRSHGKKPSVFVTMNGRKATLREWSKILKQPYLRVSGYYYNHGHSLEGFGKRKRGRPSK